MPALIAAAALQSRDEVAATVVVPAVVLPRALARKA
jgi:hypothetical protein